MSLEVELGQMLIQWANATGAAKDALFNQIITFMVNNPGVGQHIIRGNAAFAAAYAAANRIPFQLFMARFMANFSASPKGPNPYLIAAVVVGSVVITSEQAKAETLQRQNAAVEYEGYVIWYMSKMAKAKEYHPQNRFESPKTFEEWYQENY